MQTRLRVLVFVMWGAVGCGGSAAGEVTAGSGGYAGYAGTGGAGTGGGGGSAGYGGTGGAGTGGGDSFHVTLSADHETICPGECVELRAEPVAGEAPYTFRWNEGVAAAPGPHRLCPTATTNYQVTVADSSVDSEFGQRNEDASASLTITVRAPQQCEDPEPPPAATEVVCDNVWSSTSWVATGGWDGNEAISASTSGGVVITGSFHGAFATGDHPLSSVGAQDGFVLLVDDNCEVVWSRSFGAPTSHVWMDASATDASGNIYVGGSTLGGADFGTGLVFPPFASQGLGVIVKLAPDGSTLWVRGFASPFNNSAGVLDVDVDSQGNVVIGGWGSSLSDLGGGPLGGLPTSGVAFVAKLNPQGTVLWQRRVDGSDPYLDTAVANDDSIVIAGWASPSLDLGMGPLTSASGSSRFLAKLSPQGQQVWARNVASTSDEWGWWDSDLALDAQGNILTEHDTPTTTDTEMYWGELSVEKWTSTGEPVWERKLTDEMRSEGWYGHIAADTHGAVLTSTAFSQTVSYLGHPLTARGESDAVVIKLDAAGELRWLFQMGTDGYDWPIGIATNANDFVWSGFIAQVSATTEASALHVLKLAP